MPVTRVTTDVSDGIAGTGVSWGVQYELAAGIPAGAVLTGVIGELTWQTALASTPANASSYTLNLAYPYIIALELGAAGFTPVVPTRGGYSNAVMLQVSAVPSEGTQVVQIPTSSDIFVGFQLGFRIDWEGELLLAAASDLYLVTYGAEQASPQLMFQQSGNLSTYYH